MPLHALSYAVCTGLSSASSPTNEMNGLLSRSISTRSEAGTAARRVLPSSGSQLWGPAPCTLKPRSHKGIQLCEGAFSIDRAKCCRRSTTVGFRRWGKGIDSDLLSSFIPSVTAHLARLDRCSLSLTFVKISWFASNYLQYSANWSDNQLNQ